MGRGYYSHTRLRINSLATAPCGAGALLFPLVHLLHLFLFFTFLFLSLALPIFFFCPSLPFLPE